MCPEPSDALQQGCGEAGKERKFTSVTIFLESMISVKLTVKYLNISLSAP